MASNIVSAKSHWTEIRCDYICEDSDDQFWRVDAWRTDDENEVGEVIAYIDDLTARVIYCEAIARIDKSAQEIIAEKVDEIQKRLCDERKTAIAKAESVLSKPA